MQIRQGETEYCNPIITTTPTKKYSPSPDLVESFISVATLGQNQTCVLTSLLTVRLILLKIVSVSYILYIRLEPINTETRVQ